MAETLADLQSRLADHLRDPDGKAGPPDVEDRRLAIYRDLIYNNIEGFISGGFPVLREIYSDEHWHELVRDFVIAHRAETPYFLQISEEFLGYLQHERAPRPGDPPFLLELAHYEWVELALDVADQTLPPKPDLGAAPDLTGEVIAVSPLLWCLSYRYPVHEIGPDYQPAEPPEQPTFILVYRDRQDRVQFMLSNAVTVRLIKKLQAGQGTAHEALLQIAGEIQHPDPDQLVALGQSLLMGLYQRDILWPVQKGRPFQ